MRYHACIVVVVAIAAGMAAGAADVSGGWRAEFSGPGGTKGVETLDLTVNNGVVTGTMTNAVGGVGQVRDGKWDGTTLRFWVPWDGSDKLEAAGKLAGATLELDFKTSQWRAKRVFKRTTKGT